MDMSFAHKIRESRNKKGMTVYDLAEKIAKSPGYISKIEARGEIPCPEMILKLAELLDIKPEDLIETAKAEKTLEVTQSVQRKYDEGLSLYRRNKKK